LNQGERRTSNIDSKLHLLGFDCFKLLIPQLHFGDFFNAIDPNRTWPISKRREDCKIVLLRTAYQFDILQCTVSVCERPDEFDQLHRREFIGWVGGATAAWPLAAHAIAGTIAEPPDVQTAECRNWRTSSRNVYALQSLSALMISRVGGF
jgi:hypothetical protein